MIRSIEVCGVAHIPNIVVHPCFLGDRQYNEKQKEYFDINVVITIAFVLMRKKPV